MLIDLNQVKTDWLSTCGPRHIKEIANHYGVYQHLFGDAYFVPAIPLHVTFKSQDKEVPVYYGNIIKPSEATEAPKIQFESDKDSLWTLILTNPDGHLTKQNAEYVHWFM